MEIIEKQINSILKQMEKIEEQQDDIKKQMRLLGYNNVVFMKRKSK